MSDLTADLLAAVVAATPDRKEAALRVLRGAVQEPAARPATGPLLMGMGAGAKFLGVSRATLWRACLAGRIQKVELFHGSYRVRREDLEALAAGKMGTPQQSEASGAVVRSTLRGRHAAGQVSEYRSKRGRPKKASGPASHGSYAGAMRLT
jgi:hypothetical protein